MIAKIVPIKRLPKQLDIFDYHIPESLRDTIALGQLVTIPMRNSPIQGIVFSIEEKEKEHHATKDIIAIIQTVPLLHEQHITFYTQVASWYGVSTATMLKLALLPMQKRKLSRMALVDYPHVSPQPQEQPVYRQCRTPEEQATVIQEELRATTQQTLIVVPETYRIEEMYHLLSAEQQQHCIVWHSGLTVKEQFEHWLAIRNGEKTIIIANRSAVFLPFYALEQVIIVHEADEQHKHAEQSPRFHVKDVVALLQQLRGIRVVYTSAMPSVETYTQYMTTPLSAYDNAALPTIVDVRGERAQQNYGVLSHRAEELIKNTNGDIFIFLNRRGFASSLSCQDCGYTHRCPSCTLPFVYHESDNSLRCHYCHTRGTISLVCGKCASPMVRLRGAGTELVEQTIRTLFAQQHTHDIIRIDADVELSPLLAKETEKPRIIIGTQRALPFIRWQQTDLIVFSSLDQQLALPEYLASESLWHFIHNIVYHKKLSAAFLIQTMNPDHLLFQSLATPTIFYTTMQEQYRTLGYPPTQYLARYMIGLGSRAQAAAVATQAYTVLTNTLTKAQKQSTVTHPYEMHPPFFRGKYWYAILVRLSPEEWQHDLPQVNKCFSPDWRIDPHPISLLSP